MGTPNGSCGSFGKGSCDSNNASAWVEALCVGKSSCVLPPDNTVRGNPAKSPLVQIFGDPCSGTAKHFATQVSGCSPPPSVSTFVTLYVVDYNREGARMAVEARELSTLGFAAPTQ